MNEQKKWNSRQVIEAMARAGFGRDGFTPKDVRDFLEAKESEAEEQIKFPTAKAVIEYGKRDMGVFERERVGHWKWTHTALDGVAHPSPVADPVDSSVTEFAESAEDSSEEMDRMVAALDQWIRGKRIITIRHGFRRLPRKMKKALKHMIQEVYLGLPLQIKFVRVPRFEGKDLDIKVETDWDMDIAVETVWS